jgi:hypothetical protein
MSGEPEVQAALLVHVTGDPNRLDDEALRTFAEMVHMAEEAAGYAGTRVLLADRASATVAVLLIFKSRTHVAALRRRTETAIEVAGVLMGGDPGAAAVEVFDVIDAAFPASA